MTVSDELPVRPPSPKMQRKNGIEIYVGFLKVQKILTAVASYYEIIQIVFLRLTTHRQQS